MLNLEHLEPQLQHGIQFGTFSNQNNVLSTGMALASTPALQSMPIIETGNPSGQYLTNQRSAVPVHQNPITNFQVLQNIRSEQYNQNQLFAPNFLQYAPNYMLPPQNQSLMTPLYQATHNPTMLNMSYPPLQTSMQPLSFVAQLLNSVQVESMQRIDTGNSSEQIFRNHGSALPLPPQNHVINSQRLEHLNPNQFHAPSIYGSQYSPNYMMYDFSTFLLFMIKSFFGLKCLNFFIGMNNCEVVYGSLWYRGMTCPYIIFSLFSKVLQHIYIKYLIVYIKIV